MVNDTEARELSGDWNIHRAGRWILAHGPKRVVIKQGEHGALLIEPTRTFYVPAFPLENVFDPTGAGDAFAGGFMAYLARAGSVSDDHIRRAMVVGATMGSYAVEQFGIRGFEHVTLADVAARVARVRGPHAREPRGGARVTPAGEYAAAGVDLAKADEAKARIGTAVAGTRTPLSVGKVGAFGGMVRVPAGMRKPTLVLSTDGVGTKVLVALQAGRFDTVGEDLVNHSVNDILVHGATPIAFMDYIAGSGLGVEQIAGLVEGIARGCRLHGMALAGGETAQMPGLYQPGTYDLAGTIIGVVEEDEALHGDAIAPGDVLLGYASTGLHTNGYTLARRIVFEKMGLGLDDRLGDTGRSVADALLAVHQSYVPQRHARHPAGARPRAHHRRRHRGQPGPRPPARVRGDRGSERVAPAAALRRAATGRRDLHRGDARSVQPRRGPDRGPAPGGGRRREAAPPRTPASTPGPWARSAGVTRPFGSAVPDGMTERDAMARAIELAWRGWGRVQPNPLVGAVVLADGEIVGEGWHAEYGQRHAEPAAIAAAGRARPRRDDRLHARAMRPPGQTAAVHRRHPRGRHPAGRGGRRRPATPVAAGGADWLRARAASRSSSA